MTEYAPPWLIAYEHPDGTLYTEEVSQEEYCRVMSGQGSTPKPDPVYSLKELFEELYGYWEDRIASWIVVTGDDEDHIIRSEN